MSKYQYNKTLCMICGLILDYSMVVSEDPNNKGKHILLCTRCGTYQSVLVDSNLKTLDK